MSRDTFTIYLRGVIISGKGEASRFTSLGWVEEQLRVKLKIDPFPGTLNVRVVPDDLLKLVGFKMLDWISIESNSGAFCTARGYPVKVGGTIYGAVILPEVTGYPADQLEIVSDKSIRNELGLRDADTVTIEVQAVIPGS